MQLSFMPWTLRFALVNTSPPATRNKQRGD
jgi:hypothetical protein